jgi:hypothetical protein
MPPTVRLDAVLGPPRRSVPVGDSSTPESRTLTPLIMVRIQVPQADRTAPTGAGSPRSRSACRSPEADQLFLEKFSNDRIARLHDFIVGCGTPRFRQRLAETVHETLGERIEGERVAGRYRVAVCDSEFLGSADGDFAMRQTCGL